MGEIALKILIISKAYEIAEWTTETMLSMSAQIKVPLPELQNFTELMKGIVLAQETVVNNAEKRRFARRQVLLTDDTSLRPLDERGWARVYTKLPFLPRKAIASDKPVLVLVEDSHLKALVVDACAKAGKSFEIIESAFSARYDDLVLILKGPLLLFEE